MHICGRVLKKKNLVDKKGEGRNGTNSGAIESRCLASGKEWVFWDEIKPVDGVAENYLFKSDSDQSVGLVGIRM